MGHHPAGYQMERRGRGFLFGLSPIVIGLLASWWLNEHSLSVGKLLGILLALGGLALIFMPQELGQRIAPQGIAAVLLAVLFHSASAVWVKRIGGSLHPMAINCGALSVAVPLYLSAWLLFGEGLPQTISERSLWATVYLAVFGTVLGFNLYFYVMKRISAGALSLVTLITPVLALLIGQLLNGEVITTKVWWGTGAILLGLLSYQWAGVLWRRARVLRF